VRGVGLKLAAHEFFLPAWLEGHVKTRYLHKLAFSARKKVAHFSATLPHPLGRRLCSSQYLVGRLLD
jgi:hypothetical protein